MVRQWIHTAHPQQVRVGPGQIERLRPVLKESGARRVLILASARAAGSPLGAKLVAGLGRAVSVTMFDRVTPGVPAPVVQQAVRAALSEQIDTVVSFGGGSAIDLGKAVCFFVEQQAGTPGATFGDRPGVIHIAIPTTFSGAEGSTHFAMSDPATRGAQVAGGPTLAPRWVIADPAAMLSLPPDLAGATGFAGLSHAIDAALSPARTPESEALAQSAIGRVYGGLGLARDSVGDLDAIALLQEGAVLAARAWQHTVPGLVHGLAQLLQGRVGVGYSTAVALLAAPVLRFNADAVGSQLEQVARSIGSSDLATTLDELRVELGLADGLGGLGVEDSTIGPLSRLAQGNPAVQANPRPVGEADVAALLETIW